jgi:hypothetical protein
MPNIYLGKTTQADHWPKDVDDLRAKPGALVFSRDIARLNIAKSYCGIRGRLPKPLRIGNRMAWEARVVLGALGVEPCPHPNRAA